jgi:DMSO/TMAO reductase YedYZ molybdopterin-dependent catalytic subunit
MSIDRRNFIKLMGTSLLLSACRTGPLPLPTPEPTNTPEPTSTSQPAATATSTATSIPPTPLPGRSTFTPAPPTATPLSTTAPAPAATPVALATRVTTNIDFYIQTYSGEPNVRGDTWSVKVEGMVSKPATLSLNDIKALPSLAQMRTLECIGNPVGGSQVGNTNWKGALFTAFADKVNVNANASWVVLTGDDGYFTSVPLSKLMNPNTMLAYEMGGEPLPRGHGFPVRMLMPGVYGQKQPKWLVKVEFGDHEAVGTWEEQGWSHEATINPNAIIDAPTENQKLSGQVFVIRGIAFAREVGVAKVEVSTDRGRTFSPAQIQHGPQNFVWTMWAYPWLLPAGSKNTIVARVTDNSGRTQTKIGSVLADTFPDGAKDMHSVTVEVKNV